MYLHAQAYISIKFMSYTRLYRWQTHTHSPSLQDRTDGRSPVRERETHTQSLPTRPHRWQVAGQGHTHTPCLQDRTDGRSPVRERETHTQSLPTRPHRWQVAGQGHTHTPCLQDRTDGRSPVRERHTQSLPTRPHRWQVAGQGETHTIPAYKTAQMTGRQSGRDTQFTYT